jgi:hypothetical protein
VVFVSEGRAEQRHDPVAHHLVHSTFVLVDRVDHQLEDGVENTTGLLGVAASKQLHRPLEIGEQDCDLLALAFQRSLRIDDSFG